MLVWDLVDWNEGDQGAKDGSREDSKAKEVLTFGIYWLQLMDPLEAAGRVNTGTRARVIVVRVIGSILSATGRIGATEERSFGKLRLVVGRLA